MVKTRFNYLKEINYIIYKIEILDFKKYIIINI